MYDDSSVAEQDVIEEKQCAKNEVWMDCPSCEERCGEKPKVTHSLLINQSKWLLIRFQPCPRICQPARCHCPAHKGYRRDAQGNCIFCHKSAQH
ncbi:unnamed protein product [Caenorhabditis bovis]|uniref:Uncharacterized protein n=1 Tax=Caenorhabditis bovis TaxID=2654633 RepID=A0A8S1FFL0_9PELO|nr:unnamed protein product [Caenorhabditis bovis]